MKSGYCRRVFSPQTFSEAIFNVLGFLLEFNESFLLIFAYSPVWSYELWLLWVRLLCDSPEGGLFSAVLLLFWLTGWAVLFEPYDPCCGTFTALELLDVALRCETPRVRLFEAVEFDLGLPTEANLRVGLLPRDSKLAAVTLFLFTIYVGGWATLGSTAVAESNDGECCSSCSISSGFTVWESTCSTCSLTVLISCSKVLTFEVFPLWWLMIGISFVRSRVLFRVGSVILSLA